MGARAFPLPVVVLPHYAGPDRATPLTRARPGDAGCDIYAPRDIVLRPGERVRIPSGIGIALPPDYEMQVRPKSGLADKDGITVLNSPGTIDEPFRGEVEVLLINTNPVINVVGVCTLLDSLRGDTDPELVIERWEAHLIETTKVWRRGEKIAQVVFARVEEAEPQVLGDDLALLGKTERGAGGFGHTGA